MRSCWSAPAASARVRRDRGAARLLRALRGLGLRPGRATKAVEALGDDRFVAAQVDASSPMR
jgi:hypothetical protein